METLKNFFGLLSEEYPVSNDITWMMLVIQLFLWLAIGLLLLMSLITGEALSMIFGYFSFFLLLITPFIGIVSSIIAGTVLFFEMLIKNPNGLLTGTHWSLFSLGAIPFLVALIFL